MRRILSLAIGALLATACTTSYSLAGNVCVSTADCSNGASCDSTTHRCVAPNATTEVVFVATPPGNHATPTATTTATAPRSVSSETGSDITLVAPRVVTGRIEIPSASGNPSDPSTAIAATVKFHRRGATPAETDTEVQSSAMTGYSARLVPGVYDVTVTPTELSQIPPYLSSGLTISADPSPLALTITYSRPSATNGYVSGRIIDADTQIAMPNVGVQAVDSSGRIVSNVQSTGDGMNGETGTFQLWISPGAPEDWSLQLISQPVPQADPNVAAGRLTYQLTRAASGAIDMYSGLTVRAASTLSLSGSVSGTCVACVDVEASLEGTNLAGMREAIASATVSLRADDVLGMLPAGHSAWFEARATSGVDGTFRARLMPGTYTAMITPPRDSSYAITSVRLEVTRSLRGQVLTVHQLVPVPGAIASSVNGSQAVRNTLIEAIPLLDPEATPNAAMPVTTIARRAQTYTEANGSFLLGLDEGEYILVAHPPDGSGLAAQIFDRFTVVFAARDAMIDPRPVPVNRGELMLSSPFAVTGFVSDSSANRIDGAGVRAFARYPVGNGLILDVEVARTTSTAGGAYTLLLPSTLVQQ